MSSPPPKRLSLSQTRRGLDKGDFYFPQIYIKKNGIKIWVNQIFLICYDYIKNNSYINIIIEYNTRSQQWKWRINIFQQKTGALEVEGSGPTMKSGSVRDLYGTLYTTQGDCIFICTFPLILACFQENDNTWTLQIRAALFYGLSIVANSKATNKLDSFIIQVSWHSGLVSHISVFISSLLT